MPAAFEIAVRALYAAQSKAKIPTISLSNAAFLCDMLRLKKAQNVLEIGTCHGLSACYWAHTISAWGGQVTVLTQPPTQPPSPTH